MATRLDAWEARLKLFILCVSYILCTFRRRTLISTYSESYKFLKNIDSGECKEYLAFKLPLPIVSTFAQQRLTGNKGLRLRYRNISYHIDYETECPVCNRNEKETLNHIIKSCPIYAQFRDKFITNDFVPFLLSYNEVDHLRKVFYFFINVIKLRAFIMHD